MREGSGVVHRLRASNATDGYGWGVNNVRMLKKDPVHLAKIMEEFQDFFGSPEGIVPQGHYGMVVVDLQKDVILDGLEGGGGAVGRVLSWSLSSEMAFDERGGMSVAFSGSGGLQSSGLGRSVFSLEDDSNVAVRFREFLEEGRISQVVYPKSNKVVSGCNLNLDMVINLLKEKERELFYFTLNMKPFNIETFDVGTIAGSRALKSRIESLGFVLTNKEKGLWRKHFADFREE
ncbi:hypothetical protein A2290_05830 [candidate division WOR-1 bacterium RIFOXYB2_FULL_36_35]|uniref:Uncharacterized protein n=1 Tax=candidate division WOR-1 bacterium RIFOXYB2_FULL_36_35 TaxID=1802578 RepID=A0A1F4S5X5_UNCSA|nr:MAG: hypothetical protein A2290_05830 [candidate division WOR-1 bacterium RIFOXYB2_FULL_36_35]